MDVWPLSKRESGYIEKLAIVSTRRDAAKERFL